MAMKVAELKDGRRGARGPRVTRSGRHSGHVGAARGDPCATASDRSSSRRRSPLAAWRSVAPSTSSTRLHPRKGIHETHVCVCLCRPCERAPPSAATCVHTQSNAPKLSSNQGRGALCARLPAFACVCVCVCVYAAAGRAPLMRSVRRRGMRALPRPEPRERLCVGTVCVCVGSFAPPALRPTTPLPLPRGPAADASVTDITTSLS